MALLFCSHRVEDFNKFVAVNRQGQDHLQFNSFTIQSFTIQSFIIQSFIIQFTLTIITNLKVKMQETISHVLIMKH
jgi:hypothetical protein